MPRTSPKNSNAPPIRTNRTRTSVMNANSCAGMTDDVGLPAEGAATTDTMCRLGIEQTQIRGGPVDGPRVTTMPEDIYVRPAVEGSANARCAFLVPGRLH